MLTRPVAAPQPPRGPRNGIPHLQNTPPPSQNTMPLPPNAPSPCHNVIPQRQNTPPPTQNTRSPAQNTIPLCHIVIPHPPNTPPLTQNTPPRPQKHAGGWPTSHPPASKQNTGISRAAGGNERRCSRRGYCNSSCTRASTAATVAAGTRPIFSACRARQSRLLSWSASTTPVVGKPTGKATSNG